MGGEGVAAMTEDYINGLWVRLAKEGALLAWERHTKIPETTDPCTPIQPLKPEAFDWDELTDKAFFMAAVEPAVNEIVMLNKRVKQTMAWADRLQDGRMEIKKEYEKKLKWQSFSYSMTIGLLIMAWAVTEIVRIMR